MDKNHNLQAEIQNAENKRFELAINAANIGIWDWHVQTGEVYFSKIWKAQIGYQDHELDNTYESWISHLHPDETYVIKKRIEDYMQNPQMEYKMEFRFRHKDGSYIWIESKADVILNEKDEVVRLFGSHTDISKRKQAEFGIKNINRNLEQLVKARTSELEETVDKLNKEIQQRVAAEEKIKDAFQVKELLLKEITHRVKNNLQIISSLINLQKNLAQDSESIALLGQTANRIQAMALIHEALYTSDEYENVHFQTYIDSLLVNISFTFDTSYIKIHTDIDHFTPTLATATIVGMIALELITNAFKHAFPDKPNDAQINILIKSKDENHFTLIVSDNGVGFPKELDFNETESLGMQVVVSLTEQLNGKIELLKEAGTAFQLIFKAN
ncbi:histidine kinase dimerization/phosphoacceptor domain -containing protein [Crocinitomix catalasitica]|uniref:histidine kinase dimerization/phosphoacceptor domain -containing protein n=1 Tax=Crocinitomix catalasitica TaxID=184607 RepID=UPI0004882CE3|nr:histidine kinase dimerization/phosphoacceptor domain -containing protein [Crocinitomix catalasitica]